MKIEKFKCENLKKEGDIGKLEDDVIHHFTNQNLSIIKIHI